MPEYRSDTTDPVLLRHNKNGVAWVTLNRPKNYNALSSELMSKLQDLLDTIKKEADTKVVVIKGAGKGFCAGHDLQEMRINNNENYLEQFFKQCSLLMQSIVNLPQPVIAQVHGTAAAAGCQLVASCDLAIADNKATFATPGVNIGLFCSTPMVAVSRKVSRKKMMKMQQKRIPRMIMKEAWIDFENMRKQFLNPKNLYVSNFGLLAQCMGPGLQNENNY